MANDPTAAAGNRTRRRFLRLAVALPVMIAAAPAFADDSCASADGLSSSQKSMRRSLSFMAVSDDPKRQCAGCAFFTAPQAGCGHCGILNGSVPAAGRCDSWAAHK